MSDRIDVLRTLGQGLVLSPLSADLTEKLARRFAPVPSFHEDENFFSASIDFLVEPRSGAGTPDAHVGHEAFDRLPVIYDREGELPLPDELDGVMASSVTLTNTGQHVVEYSATGQPVASRPPEDVAYEVFPVDSANGVNHPDARQELVVYAEVRGVLENYLADLELRLDPPTEVQDPENEQPYLDPMRGPVDWPHLDRLAIGRLALAEAQTRRANGHPLPNLIEGLASTLPAGAEPQSHVAFGLLVNWWIDLHRRQIWEEGLTFAKGIEGMDPPTPKPNWMNDRFEQSLRSEVFLEFHYIYPYNDLFAHNWECDALGKDHEADREPAGFVFHRQDIIDLEAGGIDVADIAPTHMVVAAHEPGNGRDELIELSGDSTKDNPVVFPAAGSHAMSLRAVTEGSHALLDMEIDSWEDWALTILSPAVGGLLWLVDALCAPEDKRSQDGFRANVITSRRQVDSRPFPSTPVAHELVVESILFGPDENEYGANDTRFERLSYPGGWGHDSHGGRLPKIGRLLGILYGGYADLYEGFPNP